MNLRVTVAVGLIALAAASRLLPHPPDFTPLAALALFGGAYFSDRRLAFAVPLVALLLTDLLLGLHDTMPFVYLGFVATVLIGFALRGRVRVLPVAAAAVLSSVLFFAITNFGVWMVGNLYPHDAAGLLHRIRGRDSFLPKQPVRRFPLRRPAFRRNGVGRTLRSRSA